MSSSFVWVLVLGLQGAASSSAPAEATIITAAEVEAVLKDQIPRNVVDQPITLSAVKGGKASVASLHRARPETSALIHNDVTETYYIIKGSGTLITGGSLGDAKPTDLTRVNAGMSQTGTRQGGTPRRVGPGDIIIIPAGTAHSFSELDSPISYLVFRFEPTR